MNYKLFSVLLLLLALTLPLLQTIPNGAEHYFMIDVGETQIVLNRWGTLHATGYPLYVMLSSAGVALLRGLGLSPALAPAIPSLVYGLAALALVYALAARLTNRRWLPAAVVVLYGLTRTVWIHLSIAEIYSFGLLILAGLLVLALWPDRVPGRLGWLALLGGLGVFHHRGLLMAAPALLYAVAAIPETRRSLLRPVTLITLLGIGLLGFLPYLYLPLRAGAGAAWVYGDPGSWSGFWDQFLGREASRFIGAPATLDGLLANFTLVNSVLVTDLTAPGLLAGLVGLFIGLRRPDQRRAALTLILSAVVAYAFHVFFYTDILSALILPITLSLAFGWLFLADWLLSLPPLRLRGLNWLSLSTINYQLPTLLCLCGGILWLVFQNFPFIRDLTTNPTGLETIALAEGAPPGSTLMIDWGPRHFAVGFARDVLGELPGVRLVSHKADFRAAITGELVTPDFTFYNRPVGWWEEQIGSRVYLSAAGPRLVRIAAQPLMADPPPSGGIEARSPRLICDGEMLTLEVTWTAGTAPARDYSVFVHLLDDSGTLIGQGDQAAPVYGWRPTTSWLPGEAIRDIYPLAYVPGAARLRYGLYTQADDGRFVNEVEYDMPVNCDA
ncbi:MAG: DUF2723 domain-containing protein [Anaerolineae bacterium]|nr:DUF2723 domain-containing protein [Anaerolineae bacterium]